MRIQLILLCICNYYDFTTPINSKYSYICYSLAVTLRGSFEIPNFGGYGSVNQSIKTLDAQARWRTPTDVSAVMAAY